MEEKLLMKRAVVTRPSYAPDGQTYGEFVSPLQQQQLLLNCHFRYFSLGFVLYRYSCLGRCSQPTTTDHHVSLFVRHDGIE